MKILLRIEALYNKAELYFESTARKRALFCSIILICFGFILSLNLLTPMIADDFAYLYIFGEKEQVSNLSELIRSQITHYKLWGGRSVVHFIAQALLQAPNIVADILNSLMYIIFTLLIYLHIKGHDTRRSISLYLLINLAIWFISPMLGDTVLWLTGSCNYLWGTSIILAFLLPFRYYDGTRNKTTKAFFCTIGMLIAGVVAGWTNENAAAGMIIIILLFFFYYYKQGWKIPIEFILGLIGVLFGFYMMISAPGNFVRGGESVKLSLFIIVYRFYNYTQGLLLNYGVLIIFYLSAIAAYKYLNHKQQKSTYFLSAIYGLGALAAIYSMLLSPQFPDRAWFGLISFLFIAIGTILYRLDYRNLFIRRAQEGLIIVGLAMFLSSLYPIYKDVITISRMDKERELLAEEARKAGLDKCYFKKFTPQTNYIHGEDNESNFLLSYYYGIYIEYEKEN